MLILHIIASVDPRGGGPIEGLIQQSRERELQNLAETHIATLDDPEAPWVTACTQKVFALGVSESEKGDWRRFFPWRRYGYAPKLVPWLRAHASDYDVIVINGIWNYAALAARRALVGAERPYFVFTHGMLDPWFRRTYPVKHWAKQFFWLFSEGPLLNNARAVFFTTEEECALARGSFWPYHVKEHVVGYGTADVMGDGERQSKAFRAYVPALGERRFLLFLSRIHPKKGCDLLIEAFAVLASAHPDLDLVIAGPDQAGWRRDLIALAEMRGIAGRIHWPGMLSGDLKWGAFRAAEAFVLTSHQENFGIVVAEAMAAAKPVLISDKVNIWREVMAGGGGLVEADDLEGAKALLRRFLDLSVDARTAMALSARRTFLERFEISKVAREIVAVLREEGSMTTDPARRTSSERNRGR